MSRCPALALQTPVERSIVVLLGDWGAGLGSDCLPRGRIANGWS